MKIHYLNVDPDSPEYDDVFTQCCRLNQRSMLEAGDLITGKADQATCKGRDTIGEAARDADPIAQAETAYEAYEDSREEPPFNENHHLYHTPLVPLGDCPNCIWLGWYRDQDPEKAYFVAGYLARVRESKP